MRVGFVGLGSMGGDQARLLAKAPLELTVYDTSTAAMQAFHGKARLADSLSALGREAEVVCVCVRDDEQVREVVEGKGGLLDRMSGDSVIVVHSTITPDTIIALAEKAASRSITLIDAPVTRTVLQGDGRFVVTMTGGAEGVTERVRPILEVFSTDIIHVGRLGAALALKISNNFVTWASILIAKQAFGLATAAGVPAEKLITVMKRNGNLTPVMAAVLANTPTDADPQRRAFLESQAGIGEKDLELAIKLAASAGVAVPTATHARPLVRKALLDE